MSLNSKPGEFSLQKLKKNYQTFKGEKINS